MTVSVLNKSPATAVKGVNVKQLLKIGSKFDNGRVVGIYKNGVLTVQGTVTRFYTKKKVEKVAEQNNEVALVS